MNNNRSKEFNNFLSNVRYVMKEEKIQPTNLEGTIGISQGYLSRLYKNEYKTMNFDIAIRIAKYLGVSLDKLCFSDLRKEAQKEKLENRLKSLEIETERVKKELRELK